ncbi:MAG: DUF4252 domain-containing protein [bacterium]|nr:DUF4252 domain-containing protein [bacterium]
MKKVIVTLSLVVMSAAVFAQGAVVKNYMEKYADNKDFVKVSVSAKMFSLFTELEAGSPEEEEFLKAVSKLKGLKVLVGEKVENSSKLYKSAIAEVDKSGYDELMTVTDAEENMKFAIKDTNGKIEELIMVVGGNEKFVLLSLYGEIDLKNISKIAKSMKVDGFENLSKIGDGDGN